MAREAHFPHTKGQGLGKALGFKSQLENQV